MKDFDLAVLVSYVTFLKGDSTSGAELTDVEVRKLLTLIEACNEPLVAVAAEDTFGGILPSEKTATGSQVNEILRFLSNGKKIDAIKLYRTIFLVGLKEGKDAIEGHAS